MSATLPFAADDYGNLTGYVMYESVEQAQCAEAAFKGEENMFKVHMHEYTPVKITIQTVSVYTFLFANVNARVCMYLLCMH